MLYVRTSASASASGLQLPAAHQSCISKQVSWVAQLHAVRTHFCERQLTQLTEWQPHVYTSLAFGYDTSLACGYGLRSAACCTYALLRASAY